MRVSLQPFEFTNRLLSGTDDSKPSAKLRSASGLFLPRYIEQSLDLRADFTADCHGRLYLRLGVVAKNRVFGGFDSVCDYLSRNVADGPRGSLLLGGRPVANRRFALGLAFLGLDFHRGIPHLPNRRQEIQISFCP